MRHQSEAECVNSTSIYSQSPECQQEALEKPESVSQARGMCSNMTGPPGVYVGDPLWMDVSA